MQCQCLDVRWTRGTATRLLRFAAGGSGMGVSDRGGWMRATPASPLKETGLLDLPREVIDLILRKVDNEQLIQVPKNSGNNLVIRLYVHVRRGSWQNLKSLAEPLRIHTCYTLEFMRFTSNTCEIFEWTSDVKFAALPLSPFPGSLLAWSLIKICMACLSLDERP